MSWVVIELTSRGEREDPQVVIKTIQRVLRDAEVYIPVIETQVGEDKATHYLLSGYIFVKHDPLRVDRSYKKLNDTKLFSSVLFKGRTLATVEDSYIENMREQVRAEVNQGIGVGDIVEVCSGPYKNINASVITDIPETKSVQVHIELRSKHVLLNLPRSVLKVVNQAPLSRFFARLNFLRSWARMARVVLSYTNNGEGLKEAYLRYEHTVSSLRSGLLLHAFIHSYPDPFGPIYTRVGELAEAVFQIYAWQQKGSRLFNFLRFDDFQMIQKDLQAKYTRYELACRLDNKVRGLGASVEDAVRAAARRSKDEVDVMQNIIIDGHNLAMRCLFAPGMSNLSDSKGRPTGMILGFLRSLGSLKKRYPEAEVWVTWDGSSQRRKSICVDYKANRKPREDSSEPLAFLKGILPLLGVRQVWNPVEEADDVIGTLVRGDLEGQTNLIFSTDKDFLQLVTEHTTILYPSIGARREILYDPAKVEHHMGVTPDLVVQLRALCGDTSDNLAGVGRVPKKVLCSLLREYGSVEKIFASNLAGVTKAQYDRLREAEPQVKLNVSLMSLVDVATTKIDPDIDPDEATARLVELEIKPANVLSAFFQNAPTSQIPPPYE